MRSESSLEVWSGRCARLGLATWVAAALLSWSSMNVSDERLLLLEGVGGALIVIGFLGWRRAWRVAGVTLPLSVQATTFVQPLVATVIIIGGVMLLGFALGSDHLSVTYLAFAGAFILVGFSLLRLPRAAHYNEPVQ